MGGTGTGWPLIGRDEELAMIVAAIDAGTAGAVVVSGAAGIGKSRLVAEALAAAESRGRPCKRVAATGSTAAIPLGAFGSLLPEIGASPAPIGLIREVADALTAGAPDVVVGVDDAHLLDDLSAALVLHLVESGSAFVVAGVRTGEAAPDAVTKLWKDGLAERIELPRLSGEETVALLEAAVGGHADGGTRRLIWEASAGNPLYLRELVGGALDAGTLAEADGVWRWNGPLTVAPRLAELLEERLAALSVAERAALEVVALAEPAPEPVLRGLADTSALEAAERHGLLRSGGPPGELELRLAHPLYGELLRARTPGVTAAAIKARLADALEASPRERPGDSLRVATWRLEAGVEQRPDALAGAAEQALTRFDFGLAERLAGAAIDAGADGRAAPILADALIGRGAYEEAEELLAAGAADGPTAIARANNLYWHLGRADDAIAILDSAAREAPSGPEHDALSSTRASFLLFEGRTSEAVALAHDLIGDGIGSGPAGWQAGMTMAWGDACSGRLERSLALVDRFLEAADTEPGASPPFALPWLRTARFTTLCFAGEFARGIADGRGAYTDSIEDGSEIERSMHAFALGWCARMQGTAESAVRWSREAVGSLREVDMFRQLSSALGELAHAEALLGKIDAAEATLAEAEAARIASFRMDEWAVGLGRAAIAAARGETSAAKDVAVETARRTGARGQRFMQAMSLYDALRYGAADLAGELGALAEEIDGELVAAFARHARARAHGEAAGLADAAEELERLGAWLYAAECAAEASRGFRDEGREASSRSWAARSAALAERCEGAATPALGAGAEAAELTRREREITTMAARGLSNREIAERLVVSVRTVENHLRSAYGKLGVTGRDELGSVLRVGS